jgi:diaminopimelate decarboxylase
MHEFKYKRDILFCEEVKVQDLAIKFATPLYVYSWNTFINHYLKLKNAFQEVRPLICYSVKANSNLMILKALVDKGAGLDIVSGGELFRALRVGCPSSKIVYASVGKTDNEIEEAIKSGILFFNVESLPELQNINRIADRMRKVTNVALRINPDIEPKTHKFITTGKLTNKFGVDFKTAADILDNGGSLSYVKIKGLHIHIGSQITIREPFVAAIKKVVDFIGVIKKKGIGIEYLNIGGGLGIIYHNETPQTADEFAKKVLPILKRCGLKIIMEPGRFIIGSAGILVVKVLYVKKTRDKKFIIVDGGMNDLIRPALYDAHHEILPLENTGYARSNREKVDIVGPICESADFFAKGRVMAKIKERDYLAITCSGAYGFSMSSNYNSRRRPAEVMVRGREVYLIRERESYSQLLRNEKIVKL